MKIYLFVTLDTECDKGPNWKVRQPLSFNNILEGVPERLQPLFEKYGIKPTYLLSPEVLKNEACVSLFKNLGAKVELGTHLHSEFIEPFDSPETETTESFQNEFEPDVEFEKLKNLTELFKTRFKFAPSSFRAGRFGISQYTLGLLEKLEYKVDSSVTPFMWWWRRRGEGVNFLGAPNQPYYPCFKDFRKPGNMRIFEVPVTLINPFWDHFPKPVLRFINPVNRLQTIILNSFFKKQLRSSWLRPTYATAEEMLFVTEYLCQQVKTDSLVLCMMFHSNEASAGMSPYNSTKEEVEAFLEQLNKYFEILYTRFEVQAIGLTDAVSVAA